MCVRVTVEVGKQAGGRGARRRPIVRHFMGGDRCVVVGKAFGLLVFVAVTPNENLVNHPHAGLPREDEDVEDN